MISSRFPSSGGQKINNSTPVDVVAADQIKIGDTVYVIKNDPILRGDFRKQGFTSSVNTAAFSPDGHALVLGGSFTGRAKVYSVDGTTVTYISDIYADAGTTALNGSVDTAVFSPDGHTLVLGGYFTGYAKAYSVYGTTATYTGDIYVDASGISPKYPVNNIVFSPNGNLVIIAFGNNLRGYHPTKAYSVCDSRITYIKDIDGLSFVITFSPDGSTLVLCGLFMQRARVYSVDGTTVTYISDIYEDAGTTAINGSANTAVFSPDGSTLILGGGFTGRAKVYSVDGTTVTYISDIYADAGTTALNGVANTAVFSPDGNTLVLGGNFTGYAKAYSVDRTTVTYISDIYADAGTTALKYAASTAVFSPDGSTLVLGGNFTGYAKVYSVDGTTVTYISDIYADAGTTALNGVVNTAVFSPDGNTLVLGGYFADYSKVYSVDGTIVIYASDISSNNEIPYLSNTVNTAAFSPDGHALVLGGSFTGRAKVYSVDGTTVTYISDIYADAGTTALNGSVNTAVFSPDGSTLVLGGYFADCSKVYSVDGTTVTYVSDIYADTGTTALNGAVNTAVFSPDGNTLVLGGYFADYSKVYSVDGTTVTYISDIYADAGTTALNGAVNTAVFSPDGSTLVLGGNFTGYAKAYSVDGTTVTYISDIYADTRTTALSNTANTAVFSPDGNTLVLGGNFTGRTKAYSVDGTTVTYVSDIYEDAGTTAINGSVNTTVFSPDGSTLILGGGFTGRAKVYSVDGTTVTYVSDIYEDAGTTALNGSANTAVFSPDGSTLILGGGFKKFGIIYQVDNNTIRYEDRTLAYLVPNGIIKNNYSKFSIGFSKSNIGVGANGMVYTIADVITK